MKRTPVYIFLQALELFQKPEIVVEEKPDILHPVFEHRNPVDAHTPGEDGVVRFGIAACDALDVLSGDSAAGRQI